jgi:DNA-binding SARP family transcriptional activator
MSVIPQFTPIRLGGTAMTELRVRLFGKARLEVDGRPVDLSPTTIAMLARLAVADGAAVTTDQLYQDAWAAQGPVVGEYKTQVQKRIVEIRDVTERRVPGEPREEPRTLLTERGRITAYRLAVPRDAIDIFKFAILIAAARQRTPQGKINLLPEALALWDGDPLRDFADQAWAKPTVRRVIELRNSALLDLQDAYKQAGRYDEALEVAEQLALENPADPQLAASLPALREQVRGNPRKLVFRAEFSDPPVTVVVMAGDLFAQDDASLAVGFCDTFDTNTDRNIVISGESTQGVLLNQVYKSDRARLDRDLKGALARVPKASVEPRSAKPRGKLTRYPVGTVATLHHPSRKIFAVAYSRMGNDLIARSSVAALRAGLDNLWDAVYQYGQLRPVAMPLIGSGLSRVHEASLADLLTMIVTSFLASSRRRFLSRELRVVMNQAALDKVPVAEILKSVREETIRS